MAMSTAVVKAQFADLELDLSSGELTRQERLLRLPMQTFLVLRILLEHAGEVVTREELQRQLWTDTSFGEFESGLNKAIAKLRDALKTLQADPGLIETIPRRGYRFNAKVNWIGAQNDVPASGSVAVETLPPERLIRTGYWLMSSLTLALILGAGASFSGSTVSNWLKGPPVIHSLAVLPLINLSNNPDEDYLADGITEELTTDLSTAKSLRVISNASTSRFKRSQLPVPQIASQLNVDAVIEGTVLRIDNTLRVSIRLIAATPERQLWAASYERNISDTATLQNQIAADAVFQIRTQLTPEERTRLTLERRINPEAHDEYLRARYFLHQETVQANRAIPRLEHAIQLDPNYAAAYAALGEAWGMQGVWSNNREVYPKALEYSQKAVSLDPTSAEAYASLGHSLMQSRRWNEAETTLRKAIQLDPDNLEAIEYLAVLLAQKDRLAEALALDREAVRNNPVAVDFKRVHAVILYLARQYDEAIAESQSIIELDPNHTVAYDTLAFALVEKGRYREAEAAFSKTASIQPGLRAWLFAREGDFTAARLILKDNPSLVNIPAAAARYLVGEKERGLTELDYLANEKWANKTYRLRVDPIFDPMRSDPRFTAIVKKTGLLDN
jgi:TolB-like protein/DNA-binding winged helix-turn-helix (wHTH) protein/Flp pilus assembly protein TadD